MSPHAQLVTYKLGTVVQKCTGKQLSQRATFVANNDIFAAVKHI